MQSMLKRLWCAQTEFILNALVQIFEVTQSDLTTVIKPIVKYVKNQATKVANADFFSHTHFTTVFYTDSSTFTRHDIRKPYQCIDSKNIRRKEKPASKIRQSISGNGNNRNKQNSKRTGECLRLVLWASVCICCIWIFCILMHQRCEKRFEDRQR